MTHQVELKPAARRALLGIPREIHDETLLVLVIRLGHRRGGYRVREAAEPESACNAAP